MRPALPLCIRLLIWDFAGERRCLDCDEKPRVRQWCGLDVGALGKYCWDCNPIRLGEPPLDNYSARVRGEYALGASDSDDGFSISSAPTAGSATKNLKDVEEADRLPYPIAWEWPVRRG